jgi:hypothetical protein
MALALAAQLLSAKNTKAVLRKTLKRLAELAEQLEAIKPIQKEYDELRAALVTMTDRDYEPVDEVRFEVPELRVELSANDVVRTVKNMSGLLNYLGTAVFLKHARFPLAHLDVLIPKEKRSQFVSRKRSGSRTCKITLL